MPHFAYKAFEREANGPSWGLPAETYAFEATSEDAARYTAYRRVAELPPGCFGVLYDGSGAQLWTGDSRSEPWPLCILPH